MTMRLIFIILITITLASCSGSKKVIRTPPDLPVAEVESSREILNEDFEEKSEDEKSEDENSKVVNPIPIDNVDAYVQKYADIAQEEMRQFGIPASITLAQGVLESGAGNGLLVKKANNHFGIKCHDWKGAVVYHDDDEEGECFRKYSLPKFSYRDHSLFLTNRGRYSSLFKLSKDDYKNWAKGLKSAGYATDKKYPDKLIRIIEKYKLYRYDGEVLGKSEKDYKKVLDKKNQHTVEHGETLYRISRKYKISVDDLKRINGLGENDIFPGQVLFVRPYDKGY